MFENRPSLVPNHTPVQYHGSRTEIHGDNWRVQSTCTCSRCRRRLHDTGGVHYRIVSSTGLVMHHVRRESITVL